MRDELAAQVPDESLIPEEDLVDDNNFAVKALPTFVWFIMLAVLFKL